MESDGLGLDRVGQGWTGLDQLGWQPGRLENER
jgi:hypothetical protein